MSEQKRRSMEDFIRDLGSDDEWEQIEATFNEPDDSYSKKLLIIEATMVLKKELEDIEDQAYKLLERKDKANELLEEVERLCKLL